MDTGLIPKDRSFLSTGKGLAVVLLWLQGSYYLATGIWPLVSIKSFQAVTGPKTDHLVTGREEDHWLVMTVAALIVAIAIPLLHAAWRRAPSFDLAVLAIGVSIALAAVDTIYVTRGVLASIYLLDAAAEVVFLLLWTILLVIGRRTTMRSP